MLRPYALTVLRRWWVLAVAFLASGISVADFYVGDVHIPSWVPWAAALATLLIAQYLAYREVYGELQKVRGELDRRAVAFPDVEVSFTNVERVSQTAGDVIVFSARVTNRERQRKVSLSLRPHVHLKEDSALAMAQMPLFPMKGGIIEPVTVDPMCTASAAFQLMWLPELDGEIEQRDIRLSGAVHVLIWDHVSGTSVEATKLPYTYETYPRAGQAAG